MIILRIYTLFNITLKANTVNSNRHRQFIRYKSLDLSNLQMSLLIFMDTNNHPSKM